MTFLSSHPEVREISVSLCGVRSVLADSLFGPPCLPILALSRVIIIYDGADFFGEGSSEVSC